MQAEIDDAAPSADMNRPSRRRASSLLSALRTRTLKLVAAALMAVSSVLPAAAQSKGRGLPIIRDAEIEQLLRDYTHPLLRAAGLLKQNVQVVIVNDRTFNAFVIDGRRIFVNTGAMLESKTPNQIIGVLAHEIGHIAGGHLTRLRQELARAQTMSILAMLVAAGAIAGGAAAGAGSNLGHIGAAALSGPQEMIKRSFLSYQRTEEMAADRAAVKFLAATSQSAKGMYETFRRFADQTVFSARYVDPYVQSHPMATDRVAALEDIARTSPTWEKKDSPDLQLRHDLARAKLIGFLDTPDVVARRYPANDTTLPARYARAISAYRFGELRGAVAQIEGLIQAQPENPYFYELKGQALLENGRAAESLPALRRAVSLAPQANLIRMMLGQALVAANDPKLAEEAIHTLRAALLKEPEAADGYRQLAMIYGRKGDLAQADLASAQAAFSAGEFKTARELAARARTRFPTGSPGWVKADDIATYKPPEKSMFRKN